MKFKVTRIANGYILTWVYLDSRLEREDTFFENLDKLFAYIKQFEVALLSAMSEKKIHGHDRDTKTL